MAAALASAPAHRPVHRPSPAVRPRPTLRVLDGGRRPGDLVAPSPRRRPTPARPSAPAPSARAPRAGRPLPTRTYWWRRAAAVAVVVVAVVVVALAVVGARTVLAAGVEAPAGDVAPEPAGVGPVHVVQPGETLWSIAADLQPDGDVRGLVDRLADRSGSGPLQVGQRIPLDGLVP